MVRMNWFRVLVVFIAVEVPWSYMFASHECVEHSNQGTLEWSWSLWSHLGSWEWVQTVVWLSKGLYLPTFVVNGKYFFFFSWGSGTTRCMRRVFIFGVCLGQRTFLKGNRGSWRKWIYLLRIDCGTHTVSISLDKFVGDSYARIIVHSKFFSLFFNF